jgi:cysteine-rich repeat protein
MLLPMRAVLLLSAFLLAPASAHAVCGDGTVDPDETCDDIGADSGDGCDADCQVEPGWECTPAGFTLDFAEVLYPDDFHGDPTWSLSDDQLTVTQAINADPAVYVSTLPVSGVSMTFEIAVNTAEDDDFIGWAIGYDPGEASSPTADWLLFDWKQNEQTWDGYYTPAGLAYSRVEGEITSAYDLWSHQGAVVEVSRAMTLGNVGWLDQTTYTVQVDYSVNGFDILVDGGLEFSERGTFPTGTFSFYTFSQPWIVYTLTSPTEGSVCAELDTDEDGVSDPDELALGTDPENPDTDGDGYGDQQEVDDPDAPHDSDGDGLIDALEPSGQDTDGDGDEDPFDPDDDGDGLPTADELDLGTDPLDPDTDGGGLTDGEEVDAGSDPLDPADDQAGDDDDSASPDDDDSAGPDDDDATDDDDSAGEALPDDQAGGCGCDHAAGSRQASWLLLLTVGLVRRRRRARRLRPA